MKKLLTILFIASHSINSSFAQQNTAELIAAEKSFNNKAKETDTKTAFLSFLADDGVVFQKGTAVNGKQVWSERNADQTQLSWRPVSAMISSGGDLGYTTGPWEFRESLNATEASDFGEYFTVWKRQKDGKLKVMADLGINHQKTELPPTIKVSSAGITAGNPISVLELENHFILDENASGSKIYVNYLGSSVHILRQGEGPFTSVRALAELTPVTYQFTFIGGETAKSKDLAYAYGNVTYLLNGKHREGNYLRVWKVEHGQWKIVAEVIN